MKNETRYRYIEAFLKGYIRDSLSLLKCQNELAKLAVKGDVNCQQYDQRVKTINSSDPVSRHAEAIINLEQKIARLKSRVDAVDMLRDKLDRGDVNAITSPRKLLQLLDDHYIGGCSMREFLRINHWGRSIFYARRRELLTVAEDYLSEL